MSQKRILIALFAALLFAGLAQAQTMINGTVDVKVVTGDATTSSFHIFNSTGTTDLFRVQANGNVGIGLTAANAKFDVAIAPVSSQITHIADFNGGLARLSVSSATTSDKTGYWANFLSGNGIAGGMTIGRYGGNWGTYVGFHTHPDDTSSFDNEPEVVRIDGNGYLGIGTTTPRAFLEVDPTSLATTQIDHLSPSNGAASAFNGKGILLQAPSNITDSSQMGIMASFVSAGGGIGAGIIFARHPGDWGTRIQFHTHRNDAATLDLEQEVARIDANGVGIGVDNTTTTSGTRLTIGPALFKARFVDLSTEGSTNGIKLEMTGNSTIQVAGLEIGNSGIPRISTTAAGQTLYVNSTTNNPVVFGTGAVTFGGDVTVAGNIAAKYQDVAEWVPAIGDLPPGTLVTIDPQQVNHVIASAHAYDTAVAGVVSPQPGIVLGEASSSKALVATTGRVRVRATANGGAIHAGDLLVASDEPGVAMLSV